MKRKKVKSKKKTHRNTGKPKKKITKIKNIKLKNPFKISREFLKKVVKNVKVPKKPIRKEEKRISTGIEGLDRLIEGGFEKESVNLIVGGSGSGKTIFAMQFLIDGIRKRESGLYITFEERKEEFYSNMLDFGWDLEKAEKSGKFIFLEYSPEKVRTMLEEGGGDIESIVLKYKIQRIVIDSITSFSLLFDDELSKRQAALALFDIIRKWDCTSLLTLQETPSSEDDESVSSIEFEADSIIFLYFVRIKNERKRFIEILKMRGTKHSTEIYPLEIKKGFVVSKSPAKDVLK